jgi:hypothetical protein
VVTAASNGADSGEENTAACGGEMATGHRSNGDPTEIKVPASGSSMQNSSWNAVAWAQAAWIDGARGSASLMALHQL